MPDARPRLAVALLAVAVLTGCSAGTAAAPSAPSTSSGLHGTEPPDPPARPSFVLSDTSGASYDFAAETAGRPTLLFFGHTDCADECPTAMADVTAALRQVPAELADDTEVVFVTVDPARDSPDRLADWLGRFSTSIVGLHGTQEQVDAAQVAAGLTVAAPGEQVETVGGDPLAHEHAPGTAPHSHDRPLGYAVSHSSVILAYDATDRLPVFYPQGVAPADIAADLPVLARTSPAAADKETT